MKLNNSASFLVISILMFFTSCSYFLDYQENIYVLSDQDKDFIVVTGFYNRNQIELGNLVPEKSTNESVVGFGAAMVEYYSEAQGELMRLAAVKNAQVPDSLDVFPRLHFNILSAIQGQHFDSAYIHHQINNHQASVVVFERQIERGKDNELVAYATQNLFATRQFLEEALYLREEIRRTR